MRILSWVQSKIGGKNEKKKNDYGNADSARYHNLPDTRKEEFSDWPHGLLAIGTFGNSEFTGESQRYNSSESSCSTFGNSGFTGESQRSNSSESSCSTFGNSGFTGESQRYNSSESSCSYQDFPDLTVEEVNKLQKELTMLLALKTKSGSYESEMGAVEKLNLPLDKFLNCPSGLEIDRTNCQKFCEDLDNETGKDPSPNTKVIPNRAKEVSAENRNAINQRSFSFLLKKMFVCGGGFAPVPSLRDPLPESRMEKILKAILNRKICRQNSAPKSAKKYLEKKPAEEKEIQEKMQEKADDGCRWVKTDAEYIVLEI